MILGPVSLSSDGGILPESDDDFVFHGLFLVWFSGQANREAAKGAFV
jgi:hypothetical protein